MKKGKGVFLVIVLVLVLAGMAIPSVISAGVPWRDVSRENSYRERYLTSQGKVDSLTDELAQKERDLSNLERDLEQALENNVIRPVAVAWHQSGVSIGTRSLRISGNYVFGQIELISIPRINPFVGPSHLLGTFTTEAAIPTFADGVIWARHSFFLYEATWMVSEEDAGRVNDLQPGAVARVRYYLTFDEFGNMWVTTAVGTSPCECENVLQMPFRTTVSFFYNTGRF